MQDILKRIRAIREKANALKDGNEIVYDLDDIGDQIEGELFTAREQALQETAKHIAATMAAWDFSLGEITSQVPGPAADSAGRLVFTGERFVTASYYSADNQWRPVLIHSTMTQAMESGAGTHIFYHDAEADELTRASRKTKREYQCTGTGFDAVRKAVYEGVIEGAS